MKQKPETRPNAAILRRFQAWVTILKRPVDECLYEAFEETRPYHEFMNDGISPRHSFIFEIDMERWAKFKRHALDKYGQDRDVALSIAMACFVDKYDDKLIKALE